MLTLGVVLFIVLRKSKNFAEMCNCIILSFE